MDDKKPMFDLQRSFEYPGQANYKARRLLYNVIDMPGQFRGQIALTEAEYEAVGATLYAARQTFSNGRFPAHRSN